MKLYYSPGACSLSPHIVITESGITCDLEKVDLKTKKTASGKDFTTVSEKGYVPLLELDNGERISEGPAIVQYLGDLKPDSRLVPAAGTLERVRQVEWLNFISTELHKSIGGLFHQINPEATAAAKKKIATRLTYVNKKLTQGGYLMGEPFTAADAYLFTVLRWTKHLEVDLTPFPALTEYIKRVGDRPKVKEALKAEGLA